MLSLGSSDENESNTRHVSIVKFNFIWIIFINSFINCSQLDLIMFCDTMSSLFSRKVYHVSNGSDSDLYHNSKYGSLSTYFSGSNSKGICRKARKTLFGTLRGKQALFSSLPTVYIESYRTVNWKVFTVSVKVPDGSWRQVLINYNL